MMEDELIDRVRDALMHDRYTPEEIDKLSFLEPIGFYQQAMAALLALEAGDIIGDLVVVRKDEIEGK